MGVEEPSSYACYVSERREAKTSKDCCERVKKTLKKLPESGRTIIILYYLGKMTTEEISKSLGVSVCTIIRRLQQARELLREDEVRLIQEVLGSVQISESVVENVMQRIANIKSPSLSVKRMG